MNQQEIEQRKDEVVLLYLQGFSQELIAKKLGTSLKTISRDFQELKEKSIEWMEALPKGELQLYHRTNFEIVNKVTEELWKLYEETKDEKLKLKILSTVVQKRKTFADMLAPKRILDSRVRIRTALRSIAL